MSERTIAYFSMEIGLEPDVPTYSGGLGMLAGDSIRSAADLEVPMVAVSLLHRRGYFYQKLDESGWQSEQPVDWPVNDFVQPLGEKARVTLEGRAVRVAVWRYAVRGTSGFEVPVYLLDTDLPENEAQDRSITHALYGGDSRYRLLQEAVLGVGGLRALRALGHAGLTRFHMNEGHAALVTLELLSEEASRLGKSPTDEAVVEAVRERCVFTTHTPVPAGHDKFPLDMVGRVLEAGLVDPYRGADGPDIVTVDKTLNMTHLALNLSRYVNGVAKRHGEVSRKMFAGYRVDSITNGVHAATWVGPHLAEAFDAYVPGWREDNFSLRYVHGMPDSVIAEAHAGAKRDLIRAVNRRTNAGLDENVFTVGFGRRATPYKRPDLLFHDAEHLRRISRTVGPVQVVYAGKAHPADHQGKELIQRIIRELASLRADVRGVYLDNYDMELCRLMVSGCDLWLNTPQPPLEASGTSGMKAALNGVPSLSVLDGWWLEGCIEGVTGWAIGDHRDGEGHDDRAADAASLYQKLESVIVPMYYKNTARWRTVMRHAIAINGSFFNTQRMVQQYVTKAYL